MFHRGQLVQCVDASDWVRRSGPVTHRISVPLVTGRVYTVASVIDRLLPSKHGLSTGVVLAEVSPCRGCRGFASWRFRPLNDGRIEVFHKIARAADEPVRICEDT